ncbi:MAG: hypothetical protein EOP50_13700 [Sphingobacteriales bacterium]|nr:MAG: hypothetical protein EOP50_13700 [Sphingobacteriales bacterium]
MSAPATWLLLFCVLLFAVLVFAAFKVRRLRGMPLYVPAFCCFCGGVLVALLGRLRPSLGGMLRVGPLQSMLPASVRYEALILPAQVAAGFLLLFILYGWVRGAAQRRTSQ